MERPQLKQQQQQRIPPQRHKRPRRNMPVATTKMATADQPPPQCEKTAKVPQKQQQEQHNHPQPQQQQQLQQQQQQPQYQNGSAELLNCQCQRFLNPFPESNG